MLNDFLTNRAALTPNKIAFIDYHSQKQISFFEFNQRSEKLASILNDKGIKKGDNIGVICRNRIEFFELLFACAKIGAVLIPFNWRSPSPEIVPLCELIAPNLVFCGQEDLQKTIEFAGNIEIINFDNEYENLIAQAKPLNQNRLWQNDETWYLIFTSGTTGTPKAVMQTYGMAIANNINIGQAINISHEDRFLNFLPLFHTAGINLHTMPAIINGCTSYIINGFDAGAVLDLVGRGEINCFFGVPQVYLLLSQHEDFKKTDISKMKNWGCGGAPLPTYLLETFIKRGAFICNGMGMTETGPTVFMMDKANIENKLGSVGKPQILTRARVIDDNNNDCPPNVAGHLIFNGPNITTGYWQNESATNSVFYIDSENVHWLKSGDLAQIDEDGYFYIVGRSKEMFISGGENIYPAEVENAILNHEQILEAAVIGIKDEKWGEIGIAFIRCNNPIPSNDELTEFCRARLAAYKVPKRFIIVDDFPRTAAGKIQKHLLKI